MWYLYNVSHSTLIHLIHKNSHYVLQMHCFSYVHGTCFALDQIKFKLYIVISVPPLVWSQSIFKLSSRSGNYDKELSVKQSISRILNQPDGVRVYFFALIFCTIDQWSSGGQKVFLQVSRFSIHMSKINRSHQAVNWNIWKAGHLYNAKFWL